MRYFSAWCSAVLFMLPALSAPVVHAESNAGLVDPTPWMPSLLVDGPFSQDALLTPMGPGGHNRFGGAIAMTSRPGAANIHWAVIGAPEEDGGGAAYIFSLAAGATEWHQEVRSSNPSGTNDYFGGAVAIDTAEIGSGTIAIGALGAASSAGKVYIYNRQADGSWKNTATLAPPSGSTEFGRSIILASDSFLIVGAPYSNGGQVFTFTRSGTTWSQQDELLPPDPTNFTHFGESLAYDFPYLVVGRPFDNAPGAAYIFAYRQTTSSWHLAQKLTPSNTNGDFFGGSIAIAGTTVFVGYSEASDYHGAVSWFTYDSSSGTWKEQSELQPSDAKEKYFGTSIAVNDSGTNLLVTSEYGAAGAHLYSNTGGSWMPVVDFRTNTKQSDRKLAALADNLVFIASPEAQLDLPYRGVVEAFTSAGTTLGSLRATTDDSSNYFGASVALSGGTALVSALGQQNVLGDIGTVNVYARDAIGQWPWQAGLPQATSSYFVFSRGCFGQVAIDGDTAVVGEPDKAVGTHLSQGVASIYVRSGGTWTLQETLYDRAGQSGDALGCSVAISNNSVIVGAPGINGASGGGYISTRTGTTWSDPVKLMASDGRSGDFLGTASTIANGNAVLGSWQAASYQGAAYVFSNSGGKWSQSQKLIDSTSGAVQSEFGYSASLARDGRTLAVGAPFAVTRMVSGGSVLVYVFDGRAWTLQQTLSAPSPADSGDFGKSVSIDGNLLAISEPGASNAYVFARSGSKWSEKSKVDGTMYGQFGTSISTSGTAFIAGASSDSRSGLAYIFKEFDTIFENGFD